MVLERIRSSLNGAADNAIDAADSALDEVVRRLDEDRQEAEKSSLPTFLGIPYGHHSHVRNRELFPISPLIMPKFYRQVVIAVRVITATSLALVLSVPIMMLLSAWAEQFGSTVDGLSLAAFDDELFVVTFVVVPVIVAFLFGQRIGQVIGEVLGRYQRNLSVFFVLVSLAGLGLLFAAQYVDRLLLDPLANWLGGSEFEEVSVSAAVVVALVAVVLGMIHQYSQLLLSGSAPDHSFALARSILPAIIGVALVRFISIPIETSLAMVSWSVYALASSLLLAGFVALLLYRFGKV